MANKNGDIVEPSKVSCAESFLRASGEAAGKYMTAAEQLLQKHIHIPVVLHSGDGKRKDPIHDDAMHIWVYSTPSQEEVTIGAGLVMFGNVLNADTQRFCSVTKALSIKESAFGCPVADIVKKNIYILADILDQPEDISLKIFSSIIGRLRDQIVSLRDRISPQKSILYVQKEWFGNGRQAFVDATRDIVVPTMTKFGHNVYLYCGNAGEKEKPIWKKGYYIHLNIAPDVPNPESMKKLDIVSAEFGGRSYKSMFIGLNNLFVIDSITTQADTNDIDAYKDILTKAMHVYSTRRMG